MTPDQWGRVSRLFTAIAERPAAARARLLDRLCDGEEPAVRRELERLLRAEENGAALPSEPLVEIGRTLLPGAVRATAPPRAGAYRLLRRIGRGAMSEVYLAMRDDDAYRRQVAVKLIRPGIEVDSLLRRFLAERQILASLDHPNIARLYDGGVAEDGRPYLAMEYVDGLPITDYCDRHRLGVAERLRLLLQVCSAVQHAHQSLLVHRDLKPGNILVTTAGQTKLLDFGIAKPLAPREGLEARTTQTGHRPMTPGYASPEQVRGAAITTASDVYSLGVVLFELLTGRRPYRLDGELRHELEQAICEQAVEAPSQTLRPSSAGDEPEIVEAARRRSSSPQELRRRLSGDLDTIVLQALRKEPDRRYYSARQLAGDVERHLSDLPIVARGDHLGYRLAKFARRHRSALAAAGVALVLATGFLAVLRRQSALIESSRSRAERVSELLLERLASVETAAEGAGPVPREALDLSISQVGGRPLDEPAALAERLETLGHVYQHAGLASDALWLFEESLGLRRRATGEDDLAVASSLHNLGSSLLKSGDFERGEALLRQALDLRRRRSAGASWALAESLEVLASHLWEMGVLGEAEPLLVESLDVRLEICPRSVWTARGLSEVAELRLEQQRIPEAVPLQEHAADIRGRLSPNHFDAPLTLEDRALLHFARGHPAPAAELFRQAATQRRSRGAATHESLARTLTWRARSLIAQERHAEAVEALRQALTVRRRLQLGAGGAEADLLKYLGFALAGDGDAEAGEALLRTVIERESVLVPPDHPRVAITRALLAEALYRRGDADAAERLFQQAATELAAHPEWEFGAGSEPRLALARLLLERGRVSEAETEVRGALELVRRSHPGGHWRLALAEELLRSTVAHRSDRTGPEALLSANRLR